MGRQLFFDIAFTVDSSIIIEVGTMACSDLKLSTYLRTFVAAVSHCSDSNSAVLKSYTGQQNSAFVRFLNCEPQNPILQTQTLAVSRGPHITMKFAP